MKQLFSCGSSQGRVSVLPKKNFRFGPRPKVFSRRQLFILQGFPHIGPRLAGRLLHRFENVERVMTASLEDIQEIPGIGRMKAVKIRDVVTKKVAVCT